MGNVAFERVGEIDGCAGDMISCFSRVWNTASVHAVPVFDRESNKRGTSGVRHTIEEYAMVELSLLEQEKTISLPEGRRAFEVYTAKKHVSGSNVGGNRGDTGSEVF